MSKKDLPIPIAQRDQLFEVTIEALQAVEHIPNANDAQEPFMERVGEIIAPMNEVDPSMGTAIMFRALLAYECLFFERDELIEAGLIVKTGEGIAMSPALYEAIARVNLSVRLRSNEVKMNFKMYQLVELGKKLNGLPSGSIGGKGGMRASSMDGDALQLFKNTLSMGQAIGAGESLGEMLAFHNKGAKLDVDINDFPYYKAMMDWREQALSALPEHEKAVYTAAPLPDDHHQVIMAAAAFNLTKEIPLPHQHGPWDRYPMLSDKDDWNYRKFYDVVSQSPTHAAIPCKYGCTPLYYVGMHGSDHEFATLLKLAPESVNQMDATERPVILDLIQKKGANTKVRMLLEAGADTNLECGMLITIMYGALVCGNLKAARMLIENGYDPRLDKRTDQEVISNALASGECDSETRTLLSIISEDLPAVSEFNHLLHETNKKMLESMGNVAGEMAMHMN